MKSVAALLLGALLGIAGCSEPTSVNHHGDIAPEAASTIGEVKIATGTTFMATTANPHATEAAYQILKRGGSAIDAAIAAQMVLGLVEPQSSGIGGGAFLLHWDQQQQRLQHFNGRETAPLAVDDSHFLQSDGTPMGFYEAVVGGHSVGVPGVLRMLELAHQQHGKLTWSELFQPAIQLAREGFVLSPRLHALLEQVPQVASNPEITRYLFNTDGSPKAIGTRLINPAYAETLEQIATEGANAFYQGELANAIIKRVSNAKRPGKLAPDDLARYQARDEQPICGDFRQYTLCGAPPPSSGGTTVLAILGILEQFETTELAANDPRWIHLFAEASRLAFADRNRYIADPEFVSVPTQALIAPRYLQSRAQLINPERAMPTVEAGSPEPQSETAKRYISSHSPALPSTSHLSIVDHRGNVVSMTSSIENAFGSRLMVGGFLLNNQLTDFSFVPEDADHNQVANRIEPGKRPRSSMAPFIVFADGQPIMAIGSPGGSRIIPYVAKSLALTLEQRATLASAITTPHSVHMNRSLELEKGTAETTQQALEAMGHTVTLRDQTSGLHGIVITQKELIGVADPRREGTAQGE